MMLDWVQRHAWIVLVAFASCVVCAHLLTVAVYPGCWFDEIEILEMGRFSVFDVHPEWSVNLLVAADGTLMTPVPYFHYLSGALTEALYRLTGGFLCGRVVMLLSLPICSIALFAWLRRLGFSPCVSLLTSLVFLVDPNATVCAHWYRPDLWCMTMVFLASTLLAPKPFSRHPEGRLVLAGALLATSVFFWITSVLFFPLVLLDLLRQRERLLACVAWIATGGIVASLAIVIPLCPYLQATIKQYMTRSEIAYMGDVGPGLVRKMLANSFDFVKIALRSPFVWVTAATGICLGRLKQWPYAALFAGLIAFMLGTRVYHLRMVYLMPWLFLFVAEAFRWVWTNASLMVRRVAGCWVALGLVGGGFVSVVLLNYAGRPEPDTLGRVVEILKNSVKGASPRVYMLDSEHELYYTGRQLGWKMYSANPRSVVLDGNHADFLSRMDAFVITECAPQVDDAERAVLTSSGFTCASTYTRPPQMTHSIRSRLAAFVYALGCPSFEVWTRRK